jgi:hypothetical protein
MDVCYKKKMEFFLQIDYYLVCLTVESFVPAAPALLHLFRCASFLPLFFSLSLLIIIIKRC